MKYLIFILLALSACTNPKIQQLQFVKISGFAQGTTYHITCESPVDFDLNKKVDSILLKFNSSLSIYDKNSIISRINRNMPDVKVDTFFEKCFLLAKQINTLTNGAFDITVAPLVNAYGFGFTEKEKVTSSLIDSLLQYVGMDKVNLENQTIVKQNKQIMIDCNAIAQGYSVDVVADFFDSQGFSNYMIEIGGEVRTKGNNQEGKAWRIGVDKPIESSDETNRVIQVILRVQNKALATSGNYRKFYEHDGIKYAHTINPKTGKPAMSNLLSATIIADNCASADAIATACMVMGMDSTKVFLEKHPEFQAYLIFSDENGNLKSFYTDNIKQLIEE